MKSEGISVITDTPLYLSEKLCVFSYMLLANNEHFSFDYEKTKRSIERIKCKNGDARIVIQMHWGIENHPQENEQQRMVAHWLIDNGADLVIGHHPHCMQSVEEYKGKMIFYSLGNALLASQVTLTQIIMQEEYIDLNGKSGTGNLFRLHMMKK